MEKITEIIPSEIFKNPDLDWAKTSFDEGNFFSVAIERIKALERFRRAAEAMVNDEIDACIEYDAALMALPEDLQD